MFFCHLTKRVFPWSACWQWQPGNDNWNMYVKKIFARNTPETLFWVLERDPNFIGVFSIVERFKPVRSSDLPDKGTTNSLSYPIGWNNFPIDFSSDLVTCTRSMMDRASLVFLHRRNSSVSVRVFSRPIRLNRKQDGDEESKNRIGPAVCF